MIIIWTFPYVKFYRHLHIWISLTWITVDCALDGKAMVGLPESSCVIFKFPLWHEGLTGVIIEIGLVLRMRRRLPQFPVELSSCLYGISSLNNFYIRTLSIFSNIFVFLSSKLNIRKNVKHVRNSLHYLFTFKCVVINNAFCILPS